MKTVLAYASVLVMIASILATGSICAQTEEAGLPFSWEEPDEISPNNNFEVLPEVYVDPLFAEDQITDLLKDQPYRFATSLEVDYDLETSGNWTNLSNGDRIWMLGISSQGALSLSVVFSNLDLPKGSQLFIYNTDHSEYIGPLTGKNNSIHLLMGTKPVSGDRLIVEYYEPMSVRGNGAVHISFIAHGYRAMPAGNNDLRYCTSAFNEKENPGLTRSASSVLMMLVDNCTRLANGVLLNNTANDGIPYVMTAQKALLGNSTAWVFLTPPLQNIDLPKEMRVQHTLYGAEVLVENSTSGSALLRINDTPNGAWRTFYSGWNFNQLPDYEKLNCLQNLGGTELQLCTSTGILNPVGWNKMQTIRISNWDDGTTMPGSAGSPLFDPQNRVNTVFVGGYSSCLHLADYFSLMDNEWINFSPYLDPSGGNAKEHEGIYPFKVPSVHGPREVVRLFPNPAQDWLWIENFTDSDINRIEIFDQGGRVVFSSKYSTRGIDVSELPRGVYYVRVFMSEFTESLKLVVQ